MIEMKKTSKQKKILTIHSRTFVRQLVTLKKAYKLKLKNRHAQLTRMTLCFLAMDPVKAATVHLSDLIDEIRTSGLLGLEGVFMTAMSAASVLNPRNFDKGMTLLEGLDSKYLKYSQVGFGINALDLHGPAQSLRSLQGTGLSLSGSVIDRWSSMMGVPHKYSLALIGQSLIFSSFPDSFRENLFDKSAIGLMWKSSPRLGQGFRNIGRSTADAIDPSARSRLYGETSYEDCRVEIEGTMAIAGAIIFGAAAALGTIGGGTVLGVGAGGSIGFLTGYFIGYAVCKEAYKRPAMSDASTDTDTGTDTDAVVTSDDGTPDDDSTTEAGLEDEGDIVTSVEVTPHPDSPTTGRPGTEVFSALVSLVFRKENPFKPLDQESIMEKIDDSTAIVHVTIPVGIFGNVYGNITPTQDDSGFMGPDRWMGQPPTKDPPKL